FQLTMARPIKKGLDYFPLDTDLLRNRKIRQMKRKYGPDAFLLYISLLCEIYANGYYVIASDDYVFDFSEQLGFSEQHTLEMIMFMLELGLFHKGLFYDKRILTSKTIQEQYIAIKRKVSVGQIIEDDFSLVSPEKPPVSPSISTQSKVKETKENITTTSPACVREATDTTGSENPDYGFAGNCERYRTELSNDEDWRAAIVRMSGKGMAVLNLLPGVMDLFENHIISTGDTGTLRNKNDYARRFTSWWRCLDYQPETAIIAHSSTFKKRAKAPAPVPSRMEEAMRASEKAAKIALDILQTDRHEWSRA
ncbi:DUF4373 domain-containing protein, partial [Parabacteroides sp.]|uniref:DUF4373 domain-containing protein n=1 Tax=Parabacteroides sp. TaxID=1869337 RepID=UPI0026E0368A